METAERTTQFMTAAVESQVSSHPDENTPITGAAANRRGRPRIVPDFLLELEGARSPRAAREAALARGAEVLLRSQPGPVQFEWILGRQGPRVTTLAAIARLARALGERAAVAAALDVCARRLTAKATEEYLRSVRLKKCRSRDRLGTGSCFQGAVHAALERCRRRFPGASDAELVLALERYVARLPG